MFIFVVRIHTVSPSIHRCFQYIIPRFQSHRETFPRACPRLQATIPVPTPSPPSGRQVKVTFDERSNCHPTVRDDVRTIISARTMRRQRPCATRTSRRIDRRPAHKRKRTAPIAS